MPKNFPRTFNFDLRSNKSHSLRPCSFLAFNFSLRINIQASNEALKRFKSTFSTLFFIYISRCENKRSYEIYLWCGDLPFSPPPISISSHLILFHWMRKKRKISRFFLLFFTREKKKKKNFPFPSVWIFFILKFIIAVRAQLRPNVWWHLGK